METKKQNSGSFLVLSHFILTLGILMGGILTTQQALSYLPYIQIDLWDTKKILAKATLAFIAQMAKMNSSYASRIHNEAVRYRSDLQLKCLGEQIAYQFKSERGLISETGFIWAKDSWGIYYCGVHKGSLLLTRTGTNPKRITPDEFAKGWIPLPEIGETWAIEANWSSWKMSADFQREDRLQIEIVNRGTSKERFKFIEGASEKGDPGREILITSISGGNSQPLEFVAEKDLTNGVLNIDELSLIKDGQTIVQSPSQFASSLQTKCYSPLTASAFESLFNPTIQWGPMARNKK